jgi:selenide,water dikinase
VFDGVRNLVEEGFVPGGTRDNWSAFEDWVDLDVEGDFGRWIVSDAQTSGGLLLSVPPDQEQLVQTRLQERNLHAESIGEVTERKGFQLIP